MGLKHKTNVSQVATHTLGVIAAVVLGYLASKGGLISLLVVGASAVFACIASVVGKLRVRELMLWAVLLIAVFNFTPALFTPTNLAEEPVWQKAVKDLPVLALLLFGALAPPRAEPSLGRINQVLTPAVMLMALLMSLDVFLRETTLLAFLASFRYYVLYPALVVAIIHLDFSRKEILRVGKGLVILGAVEGCLAIPNFVGVIGESYYEGYILVGGNEYTRPTATLGNPNNLGLFLGLPATLLLARAVFDDWRGKVLLAPILVGMVLSFSRTVAVAVALTLIGLAVFERTRSAWLRAGVTVALAAGGFFFTVAARGRRSFSAESLWGSRTTNVPEAFAQWTSSPSTLLFGDGYGSQENVAGFRTTGQLTTDNMFLQLALEGGVLGLVVFGLVVYAALRLAFAARAAVASSLANGLAAYLVFFLIYSFVSSNFRLFPGALFFWIGAGFLVALRTGESRVETGGRI